MPRSKDDVAAATASVWCENGMQREKSNQVTQSRRLALEDMEEMEDGFRCSDYFTVCFL